MKSACSTLKKVMVAPSSTKPYRILFFFGQIVGRIDGRLHALHCQEGGQICGVGRYDDEGEEPSDSSHDPGRQSLGHNLRSCGPSINRSKISPSFHHFTPPDKPF